MNIVKILIVDDHPLFSKGLASLILTRPTYKVIAETSNSADALAAVREHKPNLAIVDLNLGDESGLDLITQILAIDNELIILVLSMHDERYYSERVLRLGAKGYIMKDEAGNQVLDAIKTVMAGKIYLSKSEIDRITEAAALDNEKANSNWYASVHKLSNRQFDIFTMLGKGYGTVEIAAKLNLSPKTIDTHKEHIKLKLHCPSSQQLRQLAVEWANHPEV